MKLLKISILLLMCQEYCLVYNSCCKYFMFREKRKANIKNLKTWYVFNIHNICNISKWLLHHEFSLMLSGFVYMTFEYVCTDIFLDTKECIIQLH